MTDLQPYRDLVAELSAGLPDAPAWWWPALEKIELRSPRGPYRLAYLLSVAFAHRRLGGDPFSVELLTVPWGEDDMDVETPDRFRSLAYGGAGLEWR
jgi:hypothetical protein